MKNLIRLLYLLISLYLYYEVFKINTELLYFSFAILLIMFLFRKSVRKDFKGKLNISNIDKMDGFDFERLVSNIYTHLGYEAYKTPDSGDFGADVIAKKQKEKIAIQCKRYSKQVGISAVQEVIGSMAYYKATKGAVVTNNYYTAAAIKLAKANNIELIDRKGLEGLMMKCH